MMLIMGDAVTTATTEKKRARDDSDEIELSSPEVKRLRDDLLGFFDDSDPSTATPDLDLFMRSFQQEISSASPSPLSLATQRPGESRLDLGYLLEASDDELGLPPPPPTTTTKTSCEETPEKEKAGISSRLDVIGEMWRFDEQILSYDEFGMGAAEGSSYTSSEYVALEELFDYSDTGFSTVDDPEFIWNQQQQQQQQQQQETLPSHLSPVPISIPVAAAAAASRPEMIP